MQPELPWNVAGIPAEAREAARAAARREGLSVGEWMTRRILRGFGDAVMEANGGWRPTLVEPGPAPLPEPVHSPRESEEMLARVSRSEAEAQNAYRTLDQQMKTVARRLETAERNQTENNRAMTQAATQINIAAREQAQAFEQMTTNVASLGERLARLECQAQNDGVKDAIKALHQGLSRVADQIAQTASQSASQMAALAGNVDSLTTQVVEAHERSGTAAQTIEAHAQAVETRIGSLDERLRVAERTTFSGASALDHTMENVERLRALHDSLEAEVRQQAGSAGQIKEAFEQIAARISAAENEAHQQSTSVQDTFEQMNSRISAGETEHKTSAERLEDTIVKLQGQDTKEAFEDRFKGIEHALSEIMHRLDYAEHTGASNTATVELTLQELSAGLEAADARNRETISELQAALLDATAKIATVDDKISAAYAVAEAAHMTAEAASAAAAAAVAKAAPAEPAPAPQPEQPILDMPPFEDHGMSRDFAHDFAPLAEEHHDFVPITEESADLPPPAYESDAVFTPDVPPSAFVDMEHQIEPGSESFLSAARRSANAAAASPEQNSARASMGGFAWTLGKDATKQPKERRKRYALAGSIFGVAVTAALAGVVLSHGVGSPPAHVPPAAVSMPYAQTPATSPAPGNSRGSTDADADGLSADEASPAPSTTATNTASANPQAKISASRTAALSQPLQTATTPALPAAAQPSQFEKLAALAKSGDSKGQLLLGLKYLEGSGTAVNEAEAARWLSRAAQQGEPFAQYRLGTLYERGRGVAANAKLAAHWYELAAKQGNRKAMHNLAVSFAEGSGEPKDSSQAAMWFTRAANLGLADSEFNLAVLYERGMGVKQSLVDAYKWYLIAAAQGDTESKGRAEALSTQLSDGDRAAALQAATSFKPQQPEPSANTIPVLG